MEHYLEERAEPGHRRHRRSGAQAVILSLMLAAPLFSCTAATGSFEGGQAKFDAAPPAPTPGGTAGDNGSGITWSDLYRDYFGPTGAASCAGNGACHGAVGKPGYLASDYLCSDKDQCWASLRDKDPVPTNNSGLIKDSDLAAPDASQLLARELRHDEKQPDGSTKRVGSMPKTPQYKFTETGYGRIRDWMKAGGNND